MTNNITLAHLKGHTPIVSSNISARERATQRPSFLKRVMIKMLMREAVVSANVELSKGFHLITLEGDALKAVVWRPGHKVQVDMGNSGRTYTPIDWDSVCGSMQLLIHTAAQGPGSLWAQDIQVGDICNFIGPSPAVELDLPGHTALFGDESSLATSIALAKALGVKSTIIIEAVDPELCRGILTSYGIKAQYFRRCAGDRHFEDMMAIAKKTMASVDRFVLTGRAAAIQPVYHLLRSSVKVSSKVYWASGKIGMS